MLTEAVGAYPQALHRDILALGYRPADMFTTLTLADMLAIVVASPPGSSLRYFLDQGWSRTDHILANLAETQAGVATLKQPYERPGLGDRSPGENMFPADVMTWEEMDALDAERAAGKIPIGKPHSRTWS